MCIYIYIFIYISHINIRCAGFEYLFRSDPQRFREKFQQFKGMGECCKPALGVWSENAIQIQDNSVQFNTFWSKKDISDLSSLKCKQKLCGFPEDKNCNRRKVLICKFYKNCLK